MNNIIAYYIQFKIFVFVLMLHTMTNATLIHTAKYSEAGYKLSNDAAFSPPFSNGDTIDLPYYYGFIIADVKDAVIGGLRVINNVDGCILCVQQPTSCGSITGAASGAINRATIVYDNPSSLILTGTAGQDNNPPKNAYDFATIDFNNTKSMLTISAPLILDIQILNAQNATLNIHNDVTFKQKLDLGSDGNILFGTVSKLNVNNGIIGNIDFVGNAGIIKLADNQNIIGDVDSSTKEAGTLEFLGTGTVEGTIGRTNALSKLKFSGAGDIVLPNANTQMIEVAHAGANVTASKKLASSILFSANGTLIASEGVDGSISTSTDNTGTITISSGDAGIIGTDDKKLKQVNLNQTTASSIGKVYASNVSIGGVGPISANDLITSDLTFSVDGTLIADRGIKGNIDFVGNAGIIKLADNQNIIGDVDSSTKEAGTLEFLGTGTVEGTIGRTNALSKLKFSGAGDIVLPNANTQMIEVAHAGANVTANKKLASSILFSANGTLIASEGVDGSISTSTDNTGTITISNGDAGIIGTDDKKLKQVNLNQTTASSIGKVYASNVSIGGVGPISANDLITSDLTFSVDGTLIADRGIKGNIDFVGNAGIIKLADNQNIIGDVDSSTKEAGTLEFLGTGTVEGTIGRTNALSKLKFSGAGDIVLPNANTQMIEVAHAGANVTASKKLASSILFSANGTLIASEGVDGSISTSTDNTGTITISSGDAGIIGTDDKKLKQVNLNQTTASSIGKVYASNVSIGGVGPISANDLITSDLTFSVDGTLIADRGIKGNIDFVGNAGIIKLADNQNIIGDVDSSTKEAGTLEFLGTGTVEGTIGRTNALSKLKFSGAGDIVLPNANTQMIEVAHAGANVTANKKLASSILFSANGTLIASEGVDGSISTSTDNTGTITISNGDAGIIGTDDKKLKQVNLNQTTASSIGKVYASNVSIGGVGPISANDLITSDLTFSVDGTLIADRGIKGNIDFVGNAGIIKLADNQNIIGDVDSSTKEAGTLEFLGTGTVEGTIGRTNALSKLKFSGAGDIVLPNANTQMIEVAHAGANVTANKKLASSILFSANGTLIASEGVDGSISTSTDNTGTITISNGDAGIIGTDDKKLKQVNLNQTTASSIGKVYASNVSIGGVGPISANDLITSDLTFSVDGTLIADRGIKGNIDFVGNAGIIKLADNQNIIGDVDSSTKEAGTLEFLGTGTVEGTIGRTNALSKLKFSGAGDIVLPNANTQMIEVAHAGANVTANKKLASSILFSANGTLIASEGVDGSISTSTDNTGTITISSGDAGIIGTDDKKLKQVNLNQTTASSIGKVYASNVSIGGVGPISANDLITSDLTFSVDGTLIADRGIKGNIDFVGNAGIIKLADNQNIIGDVDSSTKEAGTLEFLGTGTVEGTIGRTNALSKLKFSGAGDIVLPNANTQMIEVAHAGANVTANKKLASSILFSANGTLIASEGVDGSISTSTDNTGTITISNGDAGIIGTDDKKLKQVNLNQTTASSIGKVYASNVSIGGVGPISANDLITSDLTFSVDGTLIADRGIKGNIDFVGNAGIIKLADNQNIIGDVDSSTKEAGTLEFLGTGTVEGTIGRTNALSKLKFSGAGDIVLPNANTQMIEVAHAGANVTANKKLASSILFSANGTLIASEGVDGSISTSTDNTGTITISSGDAGIIGTDDKKLKQVNLNQTTASSIGKVYANNINVTKGPILFHDHIHANNIYIDNSHMGISDNIVIYGNINASNTNILLDNKTLTLHGTNTFTNQITISSTYDEYSLSGGNIILTSGSTLDLSNVSSLIIKLLCVNSDISKINNTTQYNIITAADGSHIVLLNDPEHQIILDSSGEQNKFVKWTIDAQSMTLYASDNSNNVIDQYVFDSQQNNTFIQQLKEALPSSMAQQFKNNIGLLSTEQIEKMLSRILDYSTARSSDIVKVALHQALTDTNRTAMNVIHGRLLNTSPAVVASDDEDVSKYGVWARSSIHQSKDQVNGKRAEYFSSYKTRGHSNTIGVDGLLRDNLLVGVAYTNAYTSIRPKDQNIGNIDKVRTNMFSLYSVYNIPNYDWYLDSTISYAESSVRGQKTRYLAVARDVLGSEVASSKYKSLLYSGSISLGYHYHIGEAIYITPSVGVIDSFIRDKGYTESGTSFQNLNVHKKNYNVLSSIAGLRTYQNIYFDNNADSLIVTPEAYGFVNYNIKNKIPAIEARLPGIDERLPIINHRSNRVDYNLGLGVTIKQNMIEYGINYYVRLAKKYQGHRGSIKVRVSL